MRILVSNDDGYYASGIQTLIKELSRIAEVFVLAPNANKSASSSSLSIAKDLTPIKIKDKHYMLDGTPSDCVHLALRGFFSHNFDLVVSGINLGANLGDDVIYSGTVAGAIEGRFLGLPSIAVSLAGETGGYFDTAASVVVNLVNNIQKSKLSQNSILNVNVPDISATNLAGYKSTRLGARHCSGTIVKNNLKNGVYQLGDNGKEADNAIGTDFYAISNNFVSITPLQIDMTKHNEVGTIENWLSNI